LTALTDFTLLDRFRAEKLPDGYPDNIRTLYSPVDQVHQAELTLYQAATSSLHIGMYGFDDDAVADEIEAKMTDPAIHVQLTLDKIEAGGKHEKLLLQRENYPNSSVAIGSSERGRIMHLKMTVVDELVRASGSTNLSDAGESLQDNELTIIRNDVVAAEAVARLNAIHLHMLNSTGARGFVNVPSHPVKG
jgi:phosphatidylserine/phosphatidylglycerophosphate/cardiolipin synthase-like enzyme